MNPYNTVRNKQRIASVLKTSSIVGRFRHIATDSHQTISYAALCIIHRVTVTKFLHIISMPAVFPPFCRASSAKCFLFEHHFLSKIALIRTFRKPTDSILFE